MSNADFGALLHSFAQNDQLHVVVYLWVADIVLGVLAAFKGHTFRLSYFADTLRNDGMKVLTWFVFFALSKTAPNSDLLGPIDFNTLADGAWVVLLAAFVGSILSSVRDLGVGDMPEALAGNEKTVPISNGTPVGGREIR